MGSRPASFLFVRLRRGSLRRLGGVVPKGGWVYYVGSEQPKGSHKHGQLQHPTSSSICKHFIESSGAVAVAVAVASPL